MADEKKYLVDVGIQDLPFPMRVISRQDAGGQPTIAHISISARIMQQFEAKWIDKFIQIVHAHREKIGTQTLRKNILDYLNELDATHVRINFEYPFFIEKVTPKSGEKCLVKYDCKYTAKVLSIDNLPAITFGIKVPCITTYPGSVPGESGGLFGQLSVAEVDVQSDKDVFPEDLVDIVDSHALSPVYSFLTDEDQIHIIKKVHSKEISSVTMVNHIKEALARHTSVNWYSVRCSNYGMLHPYSTVISTEKSRWLPLSGYEREEDI